MEILKQLDHPNVVRLEEARWRRVSHVCRFCHFLCALRCAAGVVGFCCVWCLVCGAPLVVVVGVLFSAAVRRGLLAGGACAPRRCCDWLFLFLLLRSAATGEVTLLQNTHTHTGPIKTAAASLLQPTHSDPQPELPPTPQVIDDPETDKLYLVLEFLEQGPVMEEDGPALPEADARAILLQVCAGLAHLHAEGVIHGDLKPGNLLRGADGGVRIIDFGSASVPAGGVDEMITRSPGTPAFTAPECCVGEPYNGRRSDVWALGATLFMLLAGAPPFPGHNLLDTYENIQSRELARVCVVCLFLRCALFAVL